MDGDFKANAASIPANPERSMGSRDQGAAVRAAWRAFTPGQREAVFLAGRNGSRTRAPVVKLALMSGRGPPNRTTTSPLIGVGPILALMPVRVSPFGPPRSRASKSRPPILPDGR